jgi:hypothetical protein
MVIQQHLKVLSSVSRPLFRPLEESPDATPLSFSTERVSASLDRRRGVLSVSVSPTSQNADATFDDEEIFVFHSEDGNVAGFEVPHFLTYWRSRLVELSNHLACYAPTCRVQIARCLNEFAANAENIGSPQTPGNDVASARIKSNILNYTDNSYSIIDTTVAVSAKPFNIQRTSYLSDIGSYSSQYSRV